MSRVFRVARALGLLACASLALACGAREEAPQAARPANLLLVTLDTTRADRLGAYGYSRRTTPNLDRLTERAVVYERAYSTSSWTLPAHASLFTGKLPTSHGARYDPEGPLLLSSAIRDESDELTPRMRRGLKRLGYGTLGAGGIRARTLSTDEITLAERLAAAGYDTGAVVAGPWLKREFGLARGFRHYDDGEITTAAGRSATSVSDAALRFLAAPREAPFFLFLNYFDPHRPFAPPAPHAEPFLGEAGGGEQARNAALYDGEIHYVDAELGRVLDRLRDSAVLADTLVVITADHGELLGEHGLVGHGKTLHEELIRIPLVVKPAGDAVSASRDPTPVQLADLQHLILAWLDGSDAPPRGPLVAETNPRSAGGGALRSLIDDRHKIVWSASAEPLLFDLESDPGEGRNLAAAEPQRARQLRDRLLAILDGLPRPADAGAPREIDAETRRALESLGYLEESGGD